MMVGSEPSIIVDFYPKHNGVAFTKDVELEIILRDFAFRDSHPPVFFLNGKPVKYEKGKRIDVTLHPGINRFVIRASDGVHDLEKRLKIKYVPAIATTIARIERDPARYNGKVIRLRGIGWGWAVKSPELARNLKLAKGNTALSRNTGSFTDGTGIVFLPISPGYKFKGDLYCLLIYNSKNESWLLKPLYIRNSEEK